MFAQTRFSIGVGVGGYQPGYVSAPAYAYNRPPCPGPDYNWVDGYWSRDSRRSTWIDGYWARQPFRGSYNYNGVYGRQGFTQDRNRGFERDRDRGNDRGRSYGQGYGQGNGQGNGQDNRRGNGYSNGFRSR
jgi:WXXGXW repeat (2 copies)